MRRALLLLLAGAAGATAARDARAHGAQANPSHAKNLPPLHQNLGKTLGGRTTTSRASSGTARTRCSRRRRPTRACAGPTCRTGGWWHEGGGRREGKEGEGGLGWVPTPLPPSQSGGAAAVAPLKRAAVAGVSTLNPPTPLTLPPSPSTHTHTLNNNNNDQNTACTWRGRARRSST